MFVLIFCLLCFLMPTPILPTNFLFLLEGTRPLVQQAVLSKAHLQARGEVFSGDFSPRAPFKAALAVPPRPHLLLCSVCFLSLA